MLANGKRRGATGGRALPAAEPCPGEAPGESSAADARDVAGALEYATAALGSWSRELDGTHRAVKTTMRRIGASERTAKNRIAGSHGPSGEHLISLMRHSDEVLIGLFTLAGREPASLHTCSFSRENCTQICFVDLLLPEWLHHLPSFFPIYVMPRHGQRVCEFGDGIDRNDFRVGVMAK